MDTVRPLIASDFDAVLRINEQSVHFLSPLDHARLGKIVGQSTWCKVVEADGEVVAFALSLSRGADYDSVNYRWFDARYRNFLYLDRVVVALGHERRGYGSALYASLFDYGRQHRFDIIACEFDLEPPNLASLAFHERYGFRELGTQVLPSGEKSVSLRGLSLTGNDLPL